MIVHLTRNIKENKIVLKNANKKENMIFYRYYVEKPDFSKVGEIIKEHLNEFFKDYLFAVFECKFILVFKDLTINSNAHITSNKVLAKLFAKIYYDVQKRHLFSHTSNLTLTAKPLEQPTTYNQFLNQKKLMLKWRLLKISCHFRTPHKDLVQRTTFGMMHKRRILIYFFIQIYKATIKIYTDLTHINIHYYLKLRIPIMRRHFSNTISQNPEYVQTHCKNRRKPFHFVCRKWYLKNNHNVDIV